MGLDLGGKAQAALAKVILEGLPDPAGLTIEKARVGPKNAPARASREGQGPILATPGLRPGSRPSALTVASAGVRDYSGGCNTP